MLEERRLINRLREAVQACKTETQLEHFYNDQKMPSEARIKIERCLTQNYLLKFGLDYFGKRDLIYIDMQGDRDVSRLFTTEPSPCVQAPAAEE